MNLKDKIFQGFRLLGVVYLVTLAIIILTQMTITIEVLIIGSLLCYLAYLLLQMFINATRKNRYTGVKTTDIKYFRRNPNLYRRRQ